MSLAPSTQLGPYEIVSLIGSGGMGEVYRARDKRLGRDVAIKVLGAGVAQDQERRSRFDREARAVAALNHPNIVNLFDIGMEGAILYTVSEVVEGESLRDLLRHGPIPVRKIIEIAVQLADGMAAAHTAGITHRDLKPENVMLTRDGRVKILDFGLARQAGRAATASSLNAGEQGTVTAHETQPGMVMGTVSYMSPEQARGEVVGHESDQFSFGLILYELVTGKRAFRGETAVHTLAAIISQEPPPIEVKLPPPLAWAIDRCLAKEPSQRYESTRDLYQDLRVLRDHLSEAYSSVGVEPVKALKNPPRFWKWMAIPSFTLFAAALWLLVTRDVGQDISHYRHTPFVMNLEGQLGAVWSPDGKAVLYLGFANGHIRAYVRYLDSPLATLLAVNREVFGAFRWSPDSKRVFIILPDTDSSEANSGAALYSQAVVGGEPERIASFPPYAADSELSPDNRTLAVFGRRDAGKSTVFLSSPLGSPFREYQPDPFASRAVYNRHVLAFSSDGTKLILIRTGDSNREEAWLLPYPPGRSAPHRVFTRFPERSLTIAGDWMPDSRHMVLARATTGNDYHLWMADTESDEAYQITDGINSQDTVTVSPDGHRLIYSETKKDLDIVSVSLADGASKKLIATDVSESMPSWSAATEKLVYVTSRNGPMEIWMRATDGSDRPIVTQREFSTPTHFLMNPSLSPDGSQVVFSRTSEDGSNRTWIMSLSGGSPERLNEAADYTEFAGTWSPDGRRFAEIAVVGADQSLSTIKVGSRQRLFIVRDHVDSFVPDWSRDGQWLTFHDQSGWNLVSPDGKKVKPLGKIASGHLAFSKDSKRLYGIREENEKTTLFSLDIATLKSTDTHELGKDLAPRSDLNPGIRLSVAPDGKSITYATSTFKSNLWLLEGFRQPGLLSRLGLTRPQ